MANLTSDNVELKDPLSTKPNIKYGGTDSWGMQSVLLDKYSYGNYTLAKDNLLNWKDEMKNLQLFSSDRKRDFESPTLTDAFSAEKARIRKQRESSAYARPDAFVIGTTCLNIPPSQISISEEKKNFRFRSLRGSSDTVVSSGRSTIRVDLDIYFNGLDDINSNLKSLIAQIKCTPFLPIENVWVRSAIDPDSNGINGASDELKSDVETLQSAKSEIDKRQSYWNTQQKDIIRLGDELKSLQDRGLLTADKRSEVMNVILNSLAGNDGPANLDSNAKDSFSVDSKGSKQTLDIKLYLMKVIGKPADAESSLAPTQRTIYNISKLQKDIEEIDSVLSKMMEKQLNSRYKNRALVGVISQVSISTVPGFVETLQCRVSMHVFNYDPYIYDFGFIKGFDKDRYTPDISQCDLFIWWYSNRFLSGSNSGNFLKDYDPKSDTIFSYVTKMIWDDFQTNNRPNVMADYLSFKDDLIVTGVSVTMRNVVQFLPVLSGDTPTCQYLGAYNTSFTMNFQTTNINRMREVRKMLKTMAKISRTNNKISRYYMFRVYNPLANLCGSKFLTVESFSSDTVQGNPGLNSMSINASEIKLDSERMQQLDRITLDSNDRIRDAAEYILDKAIEYVRDTSDNKKNTIQYKVYYDMLFSTNPEGQSSLSMVIDSNVRRKENTIFTGSNGNSQKIRGLMIDKLIVTQQANPEQRRNEGFVGPFGAGSREWIDENSLVYSPITSSKYVNGIFESAKSGSTIDLGIGRPVDFESSRDFIIDAIAEEQIDTIKGYLLEDVGLSDLKSHVFSKASSNANLPKHLVEESCYPDLQLPIFNELGSIGSKLKMTYGEAGLLTNVPEKSNYPAQIDWVAVDPDFFFWRGNISKIMENIGGYGIDAGTKMFKNMALLQQRSEGSPVSSAEIQKIVAKTTSLNEDVPVSAKDADGVSANDVGDAINGKPVKIVEVVDSQTIGVQELTSDGSSVTGKVFYIRPDDYVARIYSGAGTDPSKANPGSIDSIFSDKRKADYENTKKLSGAILNSVAYVYVDGGSPQPLSKDGKNIFMASVILRGDSKNPNGSKIGNIASENGVQLESNGSFVSEPDNITDEEAFKFLGEITTINPVSAVSMTKEFVSGKVQKGVSVAKGVMSSIADSISFLSGDKDKIPDETKSIGAVPSGDLRKKNNRNIKLASFNDKKDPNKTILRFDRFGEQHMNGIIERVTKQNQEMSMRMVNAFPTFRLYFIEENKIESDSLKMIPVVGPLIGEYRSLDDLYSYNAVMSIDIMKSRKEAADTAIIQILNTRGKLDRDRFGLHDSQTKNINQSITQNNQKSDRNTAGTHENLDEFILKSGTRIKVKMGYCSDSSFLETVFTGTIMEVGAGDMITVIAQGYGIELTNKITGWGTVLSTNSWAPLGGASFSGLPGGIIKLLFSSTASLIRTLLDKPEVMHFGGRVWEPVGGRESNYQFGGRPVATYGNGFYYKHPTWLRSWGLIDWWVKHTHDNRSDNIWVPETTYVENLLHGENSVFHIKDSTIWNVLQEFTRRMPGYIASVLPFDNRATVYFGPADGYYCYSNEVRGLLAEERSFFKDQDIMFANAVSSGVVSRMSSSDINKLIDKVNNLVKQYSNADSSSVPQDKAGVQWVKISGMYYPIVSSPEGANQVLDYTMEKISELNISDGQDAIMDMKNLLTVNENGISDITLANIDMPYGYLAGYNLLAYPSDKYLDNLELYTDKNGRFFTKNDYINKRTGNALYMPANLKLIRNYHYKDSVRHIVSNNIVASEENMWNRVEVTGGIQGSYMDFAGFTSFVSGVSRTGKTVRVSVDDSIWKEAFRTKVCNEPNAGNLEQLWMYAIGNLKYGVNEMYSGTLTVLGDPTIKPNDVIFINDYYTDMHGAIEVREVIHHFSHETGFITNIVPDCICYANNSMAMASDALAGGWYDDVANSLISVYQHSLPFLTLDEKKNSSYSVGQNGVTNGLSRVPFIRSALQIASQGLPLNMAKETATRAIGFLNPLAYSKFRNTYNVLRWACPFSSVGSWSKNRREPINFLPLFYGGRPYIAGVKGMRRNSWFEATLERWNRFKYFWFNQAPRYLSEVADSYVDESLGSVAWNGKSKDVDRFSRVV